MADRESSTLVRQQARLRLRSRQSSRAPKGDGQPCYVCASHQGGCGKIRFLAKGFDEEVLNRLFSRLDTTQLHVPASQDAIDEEMPKLARLEALKKQMAELARDGDMDLAEFQACPKPSGLSDVYGATGRCRRW